MIHGALRDWRRAACLLGLAGALQFVVVTVIAMGLYPVPYSFAGHFFSDLGLTHVHAGPGGALVPNPTSSLLFCATLTAVGASMLPFWVALASVAPAGAARVFARLGALCGFLSSPLLAAVGWIPADVALRTHILVAQGFFLAYGAAILCTSIATLLGGAFQPRRFAAIGAAIFALAVFHVFAPQGRFLPLVQKVTVYAFIFWGALQTARVYSLRSARPSPSEGRAGRIPPLAEPDSKIAGAAPEEAGANAPPAAP